MGMIAKPDQREWKQNRLTKRKMACQLEDDEDELSGRGEWMVLSDINRVAASKPATTAKKKKMNEKTARAHASSIPKSAIYICVAGFREHPNDRNSASHSL